MKGAQLSQHKGSDFYPKIWDLSVKSLDVLLVPMWALWVLQIPPQSKDIFNRLMCKCERVCCLSLC